MSQWVSLRARWASAAMKGLSFGLIILSTGVASGWLAGCSSESSSSEDTAGGEDADVENDGLAQEEGGGEADTATHPTNTKGYCITTGDCADGWCDKRKTGCVECYLNAHCPEDARCFNGICFPADPCEEDEDCEEGRCQANKCVECLANSDCPTDWECVETVCRPERKACEAENDCGGMGGGCSPSLSQCVACLDQSQCIQNEYCLDGECRPDPCAPSSVVCANANSLKICRDDGQGSWIQPCEEGTQCIGGLCTVPQCTEPGTSRCLKEKVEVCSENGFKIISNCPPTQECIDGGCVPLRQRVLVIFDTSGSMNIAPKLNGYPDLCQAGGQSCIQPWPTCDAEAEPITVLGVSKRVFGNFFKSEASQDVSFALTRFPQRPANAAPVCDGGYERGDVVIQGDTNVHEIPIGVDTWFDKNISDILLVPFPPPGSTSNLLAINQWLDFKESLFKTEDPCFQHTDCKNGVCLGPSGNRRCHLYTNPELRAHGWTPLGKSLFYAGEYFRRYVVIDGQACQQDSDCASPGYFCNEETNKCYDPRKGCRLNVVVLFTDGIETQHPFTNSFFNPQVQAKRLRMGLGCSGNADCSSLRYCRPALKNTKCTTDDQCTGKLTCQPSGFCGDPDDLECFDNFCKESAAGNYCTNAVIEGQNPSTGESVIGGPAQPILTFRDTLYGADRLRDFNGNPIDLIVNVVDASLSDPEAAAAGSLGPNSQIALNGGGLHVVVSVNNEADFLAKLRSTIDLKNLITQCTVVGP